MPTKPARRPRKCTVASPRETGSVTLADVAQVAGVLIPRPDGIFLTGFINSR